MTFSFTLAPASVDLRSMQLDVVIIDMNMKFTRDLLVEKLQCLLAATKNNCSSFIHESSRLRFPRSQKLFTSVNTLERFETQTN